MSLNNKDSNDSLEQSFDDINTHKVQVNGSINTNQCELITDHNDRDDDHDAREDDHDAREDTPDDHIHSDDTPDDHIHNDDTDSHNNIPIKMRSSDVQHHKAMKNVSIEDIEENGDIIIIDNDDDEDDGIDSNSNAKDKSYVRSSSFTPHMKDRMRRKLRYYFMSPIDKFHAKKRLPWKLGLQIIKIIVVTTQLIIFGYGMSKYLTHEGNMIVTFREVFLSNWDPVREVMTYPPAAGPYAIYTKDDFYTGVDYAIQRFANISQLTIGSFGYATDGPKDMSVVVLCKKYYINGTADATKFNYYYNNAIVKRCITIDNLYPPGDNQWLSFSILQFLKESNFSINFDRLIKFELTLPLRTIYLNSLAQYDPPECYNVNVSIIYDNTLHDGQMLVYLKSKQSIMKCNGNLNDQNNSEHNYTVCQVLNGCVIVLCSASLMLCVRSVINGQKLRRETEIFFKKHMGKSLTFHEMTEFIDFWIVMIIMNDLMIIGGSALKIRMEQQYVENPKYITCSILLGVGNLLVWAGLLRYLGFFHKYSILILTVRRAMPNVMRFMVCAMLLYGGFCFCGWVVLGPYHLKFRTLSSTSECLFALMNGDDMFATFYITEYRDNLVIWWFSRIYLYLFICLFIYVVISLFIAIIMDSYETIKEYYSHGLPLNNIQRFVSECTDESTSRLYMEDLNNKSIPSRFVMYFKRLFRQSSIPYNGM